MNYKKTVCFVFILFTLIFSGCESNHIESITVPDAVSDFTFTVLKAGQADAIFMKTQNKTVIIDCGEKDDGDELVELIHKNNITNIDYLFITHFDKDHVGGFPEVINNVTATNIMVPDYEGNNDEYNAYLETVKEKKLNIKQLTDDISFVVDDVLFEVSTPKKQAYAEGDNDFSLVISVSHGENSFLFAGDAEEGRLPEVLSEFGRKYDFLKVPHHGKHNSVSKRFINTVKPDYAVVTDSDKNPMSDKIISLFNSAGTKLYSTKNGDVTVISDGKTIAVSQ
ncbi:MBL fold metallo-hydrolase [bacterium]|nr:MBL fold metallo-hydrolase [bacterium]